MSALATTTFGQILPDFTAPDSLISPNALVRSALFGISKSASGVLLTRKKISSSEGIDIVYTGPVLVQSDLDVWHGLLALGKIKNEETDSVDVGAKQLLELLGRTTGKTDREWLKNSIAKLSATTIEVSFGDVTYGGSLVDKFLRNDWNGRYIVKLNPDLAQLFAPNSWSLVNFSERAKLRHKPLAQWIHAFYSTHRTPLDYGVEKIMHICGSEMRVSDFRRQLVGALQAVAHATGWVCEIDNDIISVKKTLALGALIPGKIKDEASRAFAEFWEAYDPRKRVHLTQARAAWESRNLDGEALEIIDGLRRWRQSGEWFKDNGKWVPAPDKFLEKKRWLDDPVKYKTSLKRDQYGRVGYEHGNVPRDYGEFGAF